VTFQRILRKSVGPANIAVFTIGILVIILLLTPIINMFFITGSSETLKGLYYVRKFDYEKYLERADVWIDLLNPQNTFIYFNNTGSETIDIVRAWILINNEMIPFKYHIRIEPGGSIDLNKLARDISKVIGATIYPDNILSLVSSRGNVFPIRDAIISLRSSSNVVTQLSYREEFIRIFPRPENTLWYPNFSKLIGEKRIEGYYQPSVSKGGTCNVKADPIVSYLDGYNNPLLLLKVSGNRLVQFELDNKQSACEKFVFKNIVNIWNLQDVSIYMKIVIRADRLENAPSLGGLYVNVSISFINSTLGRISSRAYESTYIPMRDEQSFTYVWQIIVKLDHRFFTVDILREYQDMEIRIDLYREGSARYKYIVGLDYVVIQGGGVYG